MQSEKEESEKGEQKKEEEIKIKREWMRRREGEESRIHKKRQEKGKECIYLCFLPCIFL